MKITYGFYFIILATFLSCKDDANFSLNEEYDLTGTMSENHLFSLVNESVTQLNDESLENLYDGSILSETLETEPNEINASFIDILFLGDNSKGEIVLSKNETLVTFTYSNILDFLEVDFDDNSRKIYFTLLDNGENIESCEYLILKRNDVIDKTEILASYNCDGMSKKQAASKYFDDNEEIDTISVAELFHTSK